jgi:DNA-binding protein HU-beta
MNKPEIVSAIAAKANLTKKDAGLAYDAFVEVIKDALAGGEEVNITGIVKFGTKARDARTARNPQTGASVSVPAKTVPFAKVSKTLKDSVQ